MIATAMARRAIILKTRDSADGAASDPPGTQPKR